MLFTALIYSICSGSSGSASFYDVNNPEENDGFTGQFSCQGKTVPSNNMYAAVASSCFDKTVCGKLASLTYKGETIEVPILDECSTCKPNQIDLSAQAWSSLESNQDIGILELTWSVVGSTVNATTTVTVPVTVPVVSPVASPVKSPVATPTPKRNRFSRKDSDNTSGSFTNECKSFIMVLLTSTII